MRKDSTTFEAAAHEKRETLVSEMIGFMQEHKKWWLMPILLAFLLVGLLVMLTATPAAPFIYTLF
ncbi:MAG: hypothetical protein KTR25_05315 [Myxococcales bacterium]|nr:hypothetical protein [Myxococcales bacterium]